VYVYDIDELQRVAAQSMDIRRQEVAVCEELIERHVREFSEWLATGGRPIGFGQPRTTGHA
jgi:glutamyl-tRNA reductase